jgi:Lrp/AsnC family transcriptional regulator, regulator for asnA, asnC and gidA
MDELDRKIMASLQLDARASNAKVAREVGVTEATVRRRLGRLLEGNFIEIRAVPNLEKLGYTTTALIGLQTMPAKQEAVADAVTRLEEVHYAAITTGAYDIFLWVGVESAEKLGQFLQQKLGVIEGIRHSETFVNLSIKKLPTG